jgi:hypothetical protein
MKLAILPLGILVFIAGLVVGRLTASSPIVAMRSAPCRSVMEPSPDSPPPAPAQALRGATPEETPAVAAHDAPDPTSVPSELWSLVSEAREQRGGPSVQRMMKLMSELQPAHAPFFLAKLREAKLRHEIEMLLHWTVLAGGEAAADGLAALLEDASFDGEAREKTLSTLHGDGLEISHLVMTPALAATGERLAASRVAEERAAAAGILGLKPRDGATEAALRILAGDPEPDVCMSALAALAFRGTPETLAWLKNYRGRKDLDKYIVFEADRAIRRLEAK